MWGFFCLLIPYIAQVIQITRFRVFYSGHMRGIRGGKGWRYATPPPPSENPNVINFHSKITPRMPQIKVS